MCTKGTKQKNIQRLISYLQRKFLAVHFNIFVQKFHANRMKAVLIKLIGDETIHKTAFTNPARAYREKTAFHLLCK